jgi:GT2 family glycosyltransferase
MDISCVILTWNSERYIDKCLNALTFDLIEHKLSFEIFTVDNGSRDQTVPILKAFQAQYPDRIFPVFLDYNSGTTYSRNLALKQARGNYIAILDCDVEVFPGAIFHLIKMLEQRRRVGLAVPKLVYSNGNLQKSTDVFPTIITKIKRYFFLKLFEKRNHERAGNPMHGQPSFHEVDYAISAMWILKQEVLEKVGFFDERILYSPEDVDYCLRIWKAGYSIVYDPTVTCVHHAQEISRGIRINRATIQHVLGLCYYFKKHRYFFKRPKIKL